MMPRSMTEFYYFDSSWCKENFNVVEPLLSKLTLIRERKRNTYSKRRGDYDGE
jgi:hypothetical protein